MQLSSNAGMEKASHSAAEQGWGLGFRAFHVFSIGLGSKCLFQSRPEQINPAWSLRLESALWPATRGGTRHRGNIPSFSQSSRNAWGRCKTKHRVSSRQLRLQRNCHQEIDCSEDLKSNKQDMYLTSCLRLDLIYLSHFAVHLKWTQHCEINSNFKKSRITSLSSRTIHRTMLKTWKHFYPIDESPFIIFWPFAFPMIWYDITYDNLKYHRQFDSSVPQLCPTTPWTAACQASLSNTNSRSPPKPMSIKSRMPSNHLILCRPLLQHHSSKASILQRSAFFIVQLSHPYMAMENHSLD